MVATHPRCLILTEGSRLLFVEIAEGNTEVATRTLLGIELDAGVWRQGLARRQGGTSVDDVDRWQVAGARLPDLQAHLGIAGQGAEGAAKKVDEVLAGYRTLLRIGQVRAQLDRAVGQRENRG